MIFCRGRGFANDTPRVPCVGDQHVHRLAGLERTPDQVQRDITPHLPAPAHNLISYLVPLI